MFELKKRKKSNVRKKTQPKLLYFLIISFEIIKKYYNFDYFKRDNQNCNIF